MDELKLFENQEFGKVRAIDVDGEPWFVGKDVALALGHENPARAIRNHVDEEDKGVTELVTPGGKQNAITINESGVYSLVLSSKIPGAKKFKHWVTAEVLPSIRKHGAYMTPDTIEKILDDPDTIIRLATTLKEERQKRKELEAENEQQRQMIADFAPIKRYVDTILESPGAMATSQIAADYDMSARALNKILHEEGIQHCVNGQWILYRDHMGKGYTKSETIQITRSDGSPDAKVYTKWTQKGRLWLNEVLNRRGIYAIMDRVAVS